VEQVGCTATDAILGIVTNQNVITTMEKKRCKSGEQHSDHFFLAVHTGPRAPSRSRVGFHIRSMSQELMIRHPLVGLWSSVLFWGNFWRADWLAYLDRLSAEIKFAESFCVPVHLRRPGMVRSRNSLWILTSERFLEAAVRSLVLKKVYFRTRRPGVSLCRGRREGIFC
jgi:hypothetical protein